MKDEGRRKVEYSISMKPVVGELANAARRSEDED
jgi:hypothetical protein